MFLLGEKYRLDLKWNKVIYTDNVCSLIGANFSGPALAFAEQIGSNDSIQLDFFKQYCIIVDNVYIGKLSWGEVEYKNNVVYLKDCTLKHTSEINKVPQLANNDVLVIDCKDHEAELHSFYPTYKTYVINEDTQVYTFEKR
jgi:hypothetical protein